MCYGLNGDLNIKHGQLAHLDQDRRNPSPENLVFLCQDCHAQYDTKSNRVQGYTPEEVRYYRDRLYDYFGVDSTEWHMIIRANKRDYQSVHVAVEKAKSIFHEYEIEISLTEGPADHG
jgi:hypothetical protein